MRVLALTKYDVQAASTRQRFVQYMPYLQANGVSVELSPLLPNSYLADLNRGRRANRAEVGRAYIRRIKTLADSRDYDLLWVQYELFPFLPGPIERLAIRAGTPVVCDYDDAIFHSYDSDPRWLVRKALGRKLEPLLSRAAAVICGNAYLKSYAERFCSNSVIVPTVVDTSVYVPRPPMMTTAPAEGAVVGWLGSPTTWRNVEPLLPTIMPVIEAHGARLRVIGAGDQVPNLPGIEAADWSDSGELAELQNMDIGIMPLLDRPFQRGKCGYKLIQYMACGLPVVASPVGVNSEIVSDGCNGFLADSGADWAKAISTLLEDHRLRARMSSEGRRVAVERYSLEIHQARIMEILKSAVAGR